MMATVYGIGQGQRTWHNEHYVDLGDALDHYAQVVEQVRLDFVRGRLNPQIIDSPGNETLIKAATICNTKKNGALGKIRFTVHLYKMDKPVCAEYYPCAACALLRQTLTAN